MKIIKILLIFLNLNLFKKENVSEYDRNPYKFYDKNFKKFNIFRLEQNKDDLISKYSNYIDNYVNFLKKKKMVIIPKQNRYHSFLGYQQEILFDILLTSNTNSEDLSKDLRIYPFNLKVDIVCNKLAKSRFTLKTYDDDTYEFINVISLNHIIRFNKCEFLDCKNKITFNKNNNLDLTIDILGNKSKNYFETIYIIWLKNNNFIIEPFNINVKVIPNNIKFYLYNPFFEVSKNDLQIKPYYIFYDKNISSSIKVNKVEARDNIIIIKNNIPNDNYIRKKQNKLFEIKTKNFENFSENVINSYIKIHTDLKNNEYLYIPYILMKKRGKNPKNEFFNENFINFGIINNFDNNHIYNLYGNNNFGKPAILTSFKYEATDPEFILDVATYYSYNIILPFPNEKFLLMKLIAKPIKSKRKVKIKGKLKFKFDVSGTEKEIHIDFILYQFIDIFDPNYLNYHKLKLNTYDQSSSNIYNFFQIEKIFIKNIFPFKIMLKKIKLQKLRNNIQLRLKQKFFDSQRMKYGDLKVPYIIIFKGIYNELNNHFISKYYYLKLQLFKINTTLYFNFYDFKLLWSVDNEFIKYNDKQFPILDFKIINLKETKKKKLRLKNRSERNIVIKSILLDDEFIKIKVYKYYNKKKMLLDSKFKFIKLNTLWEKKEIIHIHFILKCKIKRDISKKGIIITTNGNFNFQINYQSIDGQIILEPKKLFFEETYPSNIKYLKIKANSTFSHNATITGYTKNIKDLDIISLIKLKNEIKNNTLNQEIFAFDFDRYLYGEYFHLSYSQDIYSENKICIKDIEIWLDSKSIMEKIDKIANNTLNFSINVDTDLQKNIKLDVEAKIKTPNFIDNSIIDFDFLPLGNLIKKKITIKNPYNKPIKMLFYVHQLKHWGIENFENRISQVLNIILKSKKLKDKICMSHNIMKEENIKYFAKFIYYDKLKFVDSEKKNEVCFLIPDNEVEKEILFKNFNLVNNFFFHFEQPYKNKKKNILGSKVIIMKDILDYSKRQPKSNKKRINCSKCLYRKIKRKLFLLKKKIYNTYNYIINKVKKSKKVTKSRYELDAINNSLYINFVNYKEERRLLKEQQVFLDRNAYGVHFEFEPFEERNITLFTVDTRKFSNQNNEVLFIKTNIILNQIIPIFYKIGSADLKVESLFLNKQFLFKDEFIFNIFKKPKIIEFQNTKFYKPLEEEFVLINKGNITAEIDKIYIENNKCGNNDFTIRNCKKFTLKPDEKHSLFIIFHPNNQIFDIHKKKFILLVKNKFLL